MFVFGISDSTLAQRLILCTLKPLFFKAFRLVRALIRIWHFYGCCAMSQTTSDTGNLVSR